MKAPSPFEHPDLVCSASPGELVLGYDPEHVVAGNTHLHPDARAPSGRRGCNGTVQPRTRIVSNGSKWAGQAPDTIEELLGVLEKHPLDRAAFRGRFISRQGSEVRFFGDFFDVSHVFDIRTTDVEVARKLASAIERNRRRASYRSQPKWRKEAVL